MVGKSFVSRSGGTAVSASVVDRILVGLCSAVWLLLVGVSVAAIVALVDLGRGFHTMAKNAHTTWMLYVIIAVSALIIVAAIPVLVRARRTPQADSVGRSATVFAGAPGSLPARTGHLTAQPSVGQVRAERLVGFGSAAGLSEETVDRVWLRGSSVLLGTMGAALVGVATATYLMAVGRDTASWTSYAIAGLVTATLPAIPWRHVRHLRCILAAHRASF